MEKNTMSQVESHIQTMRTAHAALADTSDLDTLWQIIHRPGWTTIAEGAFLLAALGAAEKVSTGQAAGA
jgi:hypothetical protein